MYTSGDINVIEGSEYSEQLRGMMETLCPPPPPPPPQPVEIRPTMTTENGAIQEGMETANKLALEIFQDVSNNNNKILKTSRKFFDCYTNDVHVDNRSKLLFFDTANLIMFHLDPKNYNRIKQTQ